MQSETVKPAILQLTVETFRREVLDDTTPILIDFWAPWCGPCRALKPVLIEAAARLEGKARVAQINVDEEPALAEAFGIRSIPTCVLMKGQELLGSYVGLLPASRLVDDVKKRVG